MKWPAHQRRYEKKNRDKKSGTGDKESNCRYFDFIARAELSEMIFPGFGFHKIRRIPGF